MTVLKKKLAPFLLVFCIVLCLFSAAGPSTASAAVFLAVNDSLEPLTTQPYFSGGATYVPYWVFTSLGLNYLYENSTALVYSSAKQIFFDLSAGTASDADGNAYQTQAVLRNGTVYLPAYFICYHFGFTCTYIYGNEYGDIVRIKNSSVMLSDQSFLDAAGSTLMPSYYNSYYGITNPTQPPAPTAVPPPPPTPTASPSPSPSPTPTKAPDVDVFLTFAGLPSEEMLSILSDGGLKATFFVTAEDVRSNPALVRKLAWEGHSLGVFCRDSPSREYPETAGLIFEAARIKTLLIAAQPEYMESCRAYAAENSLALCSEGLDAMYGSEEIQASAVTSVIELSVGYIVVCFDCGKTVEGILPFIAQYLKAGKFDVYALREASLPVNQSI